MKTYQVQIDDETEEMLTNLSVVARCDKEALIASIVRDVLIDDAAGHPQTNVVPFRARR